MQNFGYLDSPDITAPEGLIAESLYAENAIVDGIRNVQKFGGLNPTGIIDEPTMKLLSTPRCGVKDITSDSERRKRFIVGSKNWKKKKITYL
jgi:matrix metalloproteinase-14 (membrane-inserted)